MAEIEEEEIEEGEEGESNDVHSLEELQNFGVGQADIKKLASAGIHSVESLQMTPKKNLIKIKGLSENKVEKIITAASKINPVKFISAKQYEQKCEDAFQISTGCKTLDELLGGGVESRSITEVFGEFRTGKTQLCHTLAVTAQLPKEQGGGEGKVIYLDTEGTFRPDKIRKIAERFGVDPEEALENITYARCHTTDQQMKLLTESAALMIEDSYSLVIVDSVTALFRVDYSGRGELSERQQKLGKFLSQLTKTAEAFNVTCFITNQVMSDPSGASFMSDPNIKMKTYLSRKPIGGHIMAHASATRLYLRKGRGSQRICKVYDSPSLPESEAIYSLTEAGVDEPTD